MAEALAVLPESRVTADAPRESMPPSAGLSLLWNGGVVRLQEAPVTIGANPDNQVVLQDRFVSAFHCRVFSQAGSWRVKDLGSTNGTYVDGTRTSESEVGAGARIRIGAQELRLDREIPRKTTPLPGVIAHDPALGPVMDLLRRAAPSMLPVMLLGESGTGKEVAARAVHELSERRGGPFVPLTGAVGSAPGAFGAADGGTLFLDEIGDLPLNLQVKLLRALEAGEVKPVGSARPRSIDVRVVCATHQDLGRQVRAGAFREDLFYRLRGVTVELPPLRARPRDVLPLAEHFLPPRTTLSSDARAALLSHSWPGNVRELRHVVQLAALLSESKVIRAHALHFDGQPAASPRVCDAADGRDPQGVDLRGKTLGELEELAIRSALLRHGGNRRAMADELGIARSSLLRKLDALGLRE